MLYDTFGGLGWDGDAAGTGETFDAVDGRRMDGWMEYAEVGRVVGSRAATDVSRILRGLSRCAVVHQLEEAGGLGDRDGRAVIIAVSVSIAGQNAHAKRLGVEKCRRLRRGETYSLGRLYSTSGE